MKDVDGKVFASEGGGGGGGGNPLLLDVVIDVLLFLVCGVLLF